MSIPVGATYTAKTTVNDKNIASAVGSGPVDVFATPMMVALFELAASKCIEGYLEDGQASVGTHINVSHSGATPIGMEVSATATVREVDRRRVEFDIVINDEVGEVGSGTHTRFVIDHEKFMQKANAKGNA